MAKFYGEIGYGFTVESVPGVWEDSIIERKYYGDVTRNARNTNPDDNIHSDITVGNTISIVADAYAHENFFAMKYIKWAGTYWTLSSVEVQRPRLLLRLGGVYNGPTATTADTT